MELQYISDNEGNHTAVIVPIKEWEDITARLDDLIDPAPQQHPQIKRKAADCVGILSKDVALQMLSDIDESRNEWENRI